MTNDELLTYLCNQGLQARYREAERSRAEERMQYELDVIRQMGFVDYFLVTWDIVRFAREQGIALSPRGSGAGCLVTYLLGMSEICPLQYRLCFERFLNPERREMPDLDIDFDWRRRDEVVDYCFERYGHDHVARIATHNTLGCRGAVRVAGAGLGSPPEVVDQMARLMPHWSGDNSIKEVMGQVPELGDMFRRGEPYRPLLQVANRLAGLPDHMGLHPCGIVISARPLTDIVPLEPSAKGPIVTQWEMNAVEAAGLLKLDLLGNRNLAILNDAVKRINERYGLSLVPEELPLDDEDAFKLLRTGRTLGIYQMESGGVQCLLRRFQPTDHEDIAAITSLYRPGPIEGGITPTYIARRQGKEPITYPDPCLEPLLGHTFGTILYQEQCLQVAHVFAGMSLGEADILRRAIAKRKRKEVTALRGRFLEGARRLGRDPAVAEHLFARLDSFGGYGFVKAHAVSCAAIAIREAYLKVRWPIEYLAAVLSTGMGYYPPRVYVEDARSFGATMAGPCINRSGDLYTVEEGGILRVGLSFIKGIGLTAAQRIVEASGTLAFSSLEDFLERTRVSKAEAEPLIGVGALDILGEARPALYWRLVNRPKTVADRSTPRLIATPAAPPIPFICSDFSPRDKQSLEQELLGFTIAIPELPRVPGTTDILTIKTLPGGTRVQVIVDVLSTFGHRTRKKRELMSFLWLSDGRTHIQGVLFPPVFRTLRRQLRFDGSLLLTTVIDEQEGERILVIGEIQPLAAAASREMPPSYPDPVSEEKTA